MAGISGTDLDSMTKSLIRDFGVSKFIIFSRNAKKGPKALKNVCSSIRDLCIIEGLKPLLAIDQEGGPVRRLKPPLYPDMPSQKDICSATKPETETKRLAKATATILREFSIDLNLAPVLDLELKETNKVLEGRCLGKTPEEVATRGSIYIRQMRELGLKTAAKHFPGIGRVKLDPHYHLPLVDAPKEQILKEAMPFKEAIECGTNFIMTSHVIFSHLDPENPVTFSKTIAFEFLRNKLGFKGGLITDDLEMKGALKKADVPQAALKAFHSGHDLLLICSKQEEVAKSLHLFRKALKEGVISPLSIERALAHLEQATI